METLKKEGYGFTESWEEMVMLLDKLVDRAKAGVFRKEDEIMCWVHGWMIQLGFHFKQASASSEKATKVVSELEMLSKDRLASLDWKGGRMDPLYYCMEYGFQDTEHHPYLVKGLSIHQEILVLHGWVQGTGKVHSLQLPLKFLEQRAEQPSTQGWTYASTPEDFKRISQLIQNEFIFKLCPQARHVIEDPTKLHARSEVSSNLKITSEEQYHSLGSSSKDQEEDDHYFSPLPPSIPSKIRPPSQGNPVSSPFNDDPPANNPSRPPFRLGRDDLDPLGGLHPPSSEGGMIMGPHHPGWSEIGEPSIPSFRPISGPDSFGQPVRLPPGAIPAGARFDPIVPMRPRGPGIGRGTGTSSSIARPLSGDPDNDELPPPGYNDMFL